MTRTKKSQRQMIDTLEARTMYSASAPQVIGYLPDYEYSQQIIANLQATHFEGLTQINYFSVLPDSNGVLPGTTVTQSNGVQVSNNSNTTSNGAGYSLTNIDAVAAAAHAAGVKVDIVVGGSGDNSTMLTNVIEAGNQQWQNFAASAEQFCTQHNLDGVDIDWEPGNPSSGDVQDYGYLLGTLRQNTAGITLSAAVNAEPMGMSDGGSSYLLNAESVQSLDTINVMDYDLGNPADGAPLQKSEADMTAWTNYANTCQVGSTGKMIMGMPFYGKATTIPSSVSNLWSVANDNNCSEATYGAIVANAPAGSIDFSTSDAANQSVQNLSLSGTFNGNDSAATWNFDGRGTVYAKTQFAMQQQYGGVLVWEIGQDYFGPTGYDQNESLLPAIQQAISGNNGGGQQNQPTQPTLSAGNDTITGTIFNDINGNGNKDKKDSGLAGWTVYIDLNNSGSYVAGDPTAVTNASGQFTFSNISDGSYIVRVEQPSNWQGTTDCAQGGDLITAADGQTSYCGLFGEQKVA